MIVLDETAFTGRYCKLQFLSLQSQRLDEVELILRIYMIQMSSFKPSSKSCIMLFGCVIGGNNMIKKKPHWTHIKGDN